MSSSEPLIQCADPACRFPDNPLGQRVCVQCQTPLLYRYLWAVGERAIEMTGNRKVGDRYYVVAPQVWLDLRSAEPPSASNPVPESALIYMRAHPHRLHVPEVYDIWHTADMDYDGAGILLLDNVPFNPKGELRPTLAAQWPAVASARQVYWLLQLLELWHPLAELGVAASLLEPDNLRVDDWRVRLRELLTRTRDLDEVQHPNSWRRLAELWSNWIDAAQPPVMQPLRQICEQMQMEEISFDYIRHQLNQLLWDQAAQLPLRLMVSGAMTAGPQRSHNEDNCYPNIDELRNLPPNDPTRVPQLAIVCDGIGGHEGGEVASQLAVRSLRLQMQALLTEIAEQPEPVAPDTIMAQIEAGVRVVNNLIASQNDSQGRSQRQRMGTTLAMALIVPQRIATATSWNYAHDLYVASVGDSRVYWITPNGCHLLTLDDVIASREVQMGRNFYQGALQRPEAEALTQALGTRDAEFLQPHVRRFVIEDDGVLLLCTDGLSDRDRVEQSWATYIGLIMREMMPLESAVAAWLKLADEKNGHDNTAVVLMHCHLTATYPQVVPSGLPSTETLPDSELTEASKALLYGETDDEEPVVTHRDETAPAPVSKRSLGPLGWILRLTLVILITAGVGVLAWWQLSRSEFQLTPPEETPEAPLTE
jgi:protein phosphatase